MKRCALGGVLLASCLAALSAARCNDQIVDLKQELSAARSRQQKAGQLMKLAAGIPEVPADELTSSAMDKFALLSLDCVDRQYPNKPGDVLEKDEDLLTPKALHPAFFGCFDWHSAVHGHWALVKALKTYPDGNLAVNIRDALNRHLGREALEAEARYLERSASDTFERPYGYGWLLRLSAEVLTFDDPDAQAWSKNLEVLEGVIVSRVFEYFFKLSLPVREGTHQNSALALAHAYDYARAAKNDKLLVFLKKRGKDYYGDDAHCPMAFEPSGEDFISPCLAEADFMRRILTPGEFRAWIDAFLPIGDLQAWTSAVKTPEVLDRKDPKIGHLIGLMFQRAWAMKGIASVLDKNDPRRTLLVKSAAWHRRTGVGLMADSGYGGEHWLASFAIYLMTDTGLED